MLVEISFPILMGKNKCCCHLVWCVRMRTLDDLTPHRLYLPLRRLWRQENDRELKEVLLETGEVIGLSFFSFRC